MRRFQRTFIMSRRRKDISSVLLNELNLPEYLVMYSYDTNILLNNFLVHFLFICSRNLGKLNLRFISGRHFQQLVLKRHLN